MIPEATLCHLAGDRARIRVSSMRDDDEFFARAKETLARDCGAVRINARTGSILLLDMQRPLDAVFRHAEADGLFVVAGADGMREGAGELIPAVDRVMEGLFRGPRHWPAEMAALMLLLAVIQIARGNILAPAVSLLWYASEAMHWAELEASDH